MKETLKSDRLIIGYLLGELPAEEQSGIEQRYFSEPDFLEQVLAVEDELIDAYLRSGLTAHERRHFESHFLASAERRERVETAEALLKYLEQANTANNVPAEAYSWKQSLFGFLRAERLAPRLLFASLLLLAAFTGVLLLVDNRRPRISFNQAQIEKGQVEQQRTHIQGATVTAPQTQSKQQARTTQPEKTPGEVSKPKPVRTTTPAAVPVAATFVLTPGLTRNAGGMNQLVKIPRRAQFVQLQLSLDSGEDYRSYSASLQRVGGGEIWSRRIENSRAGGRTKPGALKSIMMRLPANLLADGEHLLTLSGTTAGGESEIAGDYAFTVARDK